MYELGLYSLLRSITRCVFAIYAPISTVGIANIPPTGAVLIVSNHSSALDPVVVYVTCPRKIAFLGKKELFENPVASWLFKSLGAIPVDRHSPDISAARAALRVLQQGMPLMITPEGTRSPTGELLPFRLGFVKLAYKTRVPILPTAIIGTYGLWPKHRKLPRLGRITIAYGKPVEIESYVESGPLDRTALESISNLVRNRIATLIRTYSKL